MPDPREHTPAGGVEEPTKPTKKRTRRVLLVDPSPELCPALERCQTEHGQVSVVYAPTVSAARQAIEKSGRIDLAVVQPQLADGSGLDLAKDLKLRDTATAAVVVTNTPDFALAQKAMRLGATDVLVQPIENDNPAQWLDRATDRISEALNPGVSDRTMMIEMPLCLGASGSVRAASQI